MEVKNIHIKGIPNGEFNDNEYLENYIRERANGKCCYRHTRRYDQLGQI